MDMEHVAGKNMGNVKLYALSTCGWCRKTRELLKSFDVEYHYVYVDLLDGEDRKEAIKIMKKLNPKLSFPTLTIEDKVIVGFNEEEINKAFSGDK